MNINEIKVPSNNSLKNEIEEILELCIQLQDNNISMFNEPVKEEVLLEWEKMNNIRIPESYKEWLRFSNGSIINGNTATFYDVYKFVVNNSMIGEELVVIGTLVGDGQFLCFSKSTGEFVWYDHGDEERYWEFNEILNIIMDMM